MTLKTKIALGVCSLGTVGGGGILASHMLQGTTIKEHLKEKKFTVLENDTAAWKIVLDNYTVAVKTKPELGFGEFKGGTNKESELKQHCDTLLNQKSKTPETIKDYKKWVWCVKEQTVSEYLKVAGLTTYKTEGDDDNARWNEKIIEHSKDTTTIKKITVLQLSKTNLTEATEPDRVNIKKSCKNLNDKKHYENDFNESKSLSTSWCSS